MTDSLINFSIIAPKPDLDTMNSALIAAMISMLFCLSAAGQKIPRIVVPDVEQQMLKRREANPSTRATELARMGNSIAAKSGFSFSFAPEGFKEQGADARYDLNLADGRRFRVLAPLPGDHPCGIYTEFPIAGVTPILLTLVIDGKEVNVTRPKKFAMDEVTLVDSSLKRGFRTWTIPMDRYPMAISLDGTKIYVDSYIDDVFIEVDARGRLRFVAKGAEPMIVTNTDLTRFPKEKDNDYLGYRRFRAGNKSYTVKFSHPCT